MQQGSNSSGANTATLTDEQILGLEPVGKAGSPVGPIQGSDEFAGSVAGDEELLSQSVAQRDSEQVSGPRNEQSASGLRNDGNANNNGAADTAEPAWLKSLEAQPEAAAEARRWRQSAMDAAALDADYYSAAPGARSALAARLHSDDPATFRAMVGEAARVLAERDPQGLAELARQLGATNSTAKSLAGAARKGLAPPATGRREDPSYNAEQRDDAGYGNPAGREAAPESVPTAIATNSFPVEAYRAFEAATNDDVARGLRDSIDRTLSATLPDGVADGARRRIAEDIFHDLNTTLSSDRDLSGKISELLRGWRFNDATRQQLSGLLTGRARKALPEVARRVVSEWTSSVLASDRAKQSRINSAVSRRDITGGRLPEPVASSALLPRQVDYARTSDEQILEL
jgi:hypothetical protein